MKQPTINQVNGRIERDQVINWYFENSRNKAIFSDNWRQRSWSYNRGGRIDRLTPVGNWIYGAAERRAGEIMGLSKERGYDYHRDHRHEKVEIQGQMGTRVVFGLTLERGLQGVWLRVGKGINYNWRDEGVYFGGMEGGQFMVKVRSNETFEGLDVSGYFYRHILKRWMYPAGLFRDIQILLNCSKREALEWYKKSRKAEGEPVDKVKAWKQLIKRDKNVVIEDPEMFTVKELQAIYEKLPKYVRRRKACKGPNIFDLVDEATMYADTDEGVEGYAMEELRQYGNKILL
jgi:hypothetical protein